MIIIDNNTNKIVKKMRQEIFIRLLISSFIYVSVVVISFIFQKRDNQLLFVILLTISSVLLFSYLLFVITQYIVKTNSYEKLLKKIAVSHKTTSKVFIRNKQDHTSHVLGIENKVFFGDDLYSKKGMFVYIDEFHNEELEINKTYEITTYRGFLIEAKEINEDA